MRSDKKTKNRGDAKQNAVKVAKAVAKKPLSTQREIAEDTGLGKTTVQEHLKELCNTVKSDQIDIMCKEDFEIVRLTQEATKNRLKNQEQESFSDIIRAGAESAKRYSLFKGDITDRDGGLKMSQEGQALLDKLGLED